MTKINVTQLEGENWEFVFHKSFHVHNKQICGKCLVMGVF